MRVRWVRRTCGQCRGYGVVSDYSGGDFQGAMDCDGCAGQGAVWLHRSGAVAEWPRGGPFLGRVSADEAARVVGNRRAAL